MPRARVASVVFVASLLAPSALAQPTVTVRAETRIELRVARRPEHVRVEGVLRDDRGEPLADRPVLVSVSAPDGPVRARRTERTDAGGRLSASFPLEVGQYRVSARFDGGPRHRAVEVAQVLDLSRAHVRLHLRIPDGPRLDLDRPSHAVEVTAESEEGGAGLDIELRSEVAVLARGTTDAHGRVSLRASSDGLGPPATGRLVVHTPGDARRAEAQTEVLVVRYRPIALDLEATPDAVRAGETLSLRGRLHDRSGPLPRRAVGLFDGEEHLATVLTDDDGRFARDLDAARDAPRMVLTARFASDAPWRPDAQSEAAVIRVEAPRATPWWWLLAPMITCAAILLWLTRRSAARVGPAASVEPEPLPAPPGIEGDPVARGQVRRDVAGTVHDADEGVAIAGARVRLESERGAHEARADANGRFRFGDVEDGAWRVIVDADGYEARDAPIQVPHRGTWAALRVRLRSLRQLAVVRYRPLADALVPERRWWAFWTPRELSRRAPSETRAEIDRLTAELERAAYGSAPPSAADVEAIGQRSDALSRRLDVDEDGVSGRR